MSDLELEKIGELIEVLNQKSKKNSFFNLESLIKIGFTLVMGSLAYAGMSYKIDQSARDITQIKESQVKQADKWEIERESIKLDIQTCKTELLLMKQQLQDMKENKDLTNNDK